MWLFARFFLGELFFKLTVLELFRRGFFKIWISFLTCIFELTNMNCCNFGNVEIWKWVVFVWFRCFEILKYWVVLNERLCIVFDFEKTNTWNVERLHFCFVVFVLEVWYCGNFKFSLFFNLYFSIWQIKYIFEMLF